MTSTRCFERQYPQPLREAERALLAQRRDAAAIGAGAPVLGVALSGGGIRSATFVLGFMQGLARAVAADRPPFLRRIDLMSTVSGGGYFGAYLGALFNRQQASGGVEAELKDSSSRSINWLRENGRYLSPNGSGDSWLAGAIVLRNWTAVTVVISVALLAIMSGAHLARAGARNLLESGVDSQVAVAALSGMTRATVPTFSLYWSPYLFPAAFVLLFASVPLGWAYWLGRWSKQKDHLWVWASTMIVAVSATLAQSAHRESIYFYAFGLAAAIAIETLIVGVALSFAAQTSDEDPFGDRAYRNWMSRALSATLLAVAALAVLGVVDTLGQTAYVLAWGGAFQQKTIGALVAGIVTLLTGAQGLVKMLDDGKRSRRIGLPIGILSGLIAAVVTLVLLTVLSAVSHGLARQWGRPADKAGCSPEITLSLSLQRYVTVTSGSPCGPPTLPRLNARSALQAMAAFIVLSFFFGRSLPFVNLSSLSQFYSARLSRTYVGASNPERQKGAGVSMTTEISGDDVPMDQYRPYEHGGPLHLINVTLNETVGGRSQIEDRDRKGLAMAVGPAGVSVGVTHHALWSPGDGPRSRLVEVPPAENAKEVDRVYRVWKGNPIEPRRLALSQWTAISGAAVAPGMGAQTSIGLSLLLAIANVRLGYWWDSGVDPSLQHGAAPKPSLRVLKVVAWIFPVQTALLEELIARFHGPHQRLWFLSDGGHFENTACYELLRRRVPLIVVCDDGADPGYRWEDVANLVRKARIDFGAEVNLLEPLSDTFGTLDDLRPTRPDHGGPALCRRHIVAAEVVYPDDGQIAVDDQPRRRARSLLVIVKPSMTGDEPLDVLQYAASHPTFPQETTSDQFFDEAQWESYRKLGEHIGAQVNGLDLENLLTGPPPQED